MTRLGYVSGHGRPAIGYTIRAGFQAPSRATKCPPNDTVPPSPIPCTVNCCDSCEDVGPANTPGQINFDLDAPDLVDGALCQNPPSCLSTYHEAAGQFVQTNPANKCIYDAGFFGAACSGSGGIQSSFQLQFVEEPVGTYFILVTLLINVQLGTGLVTWSSTPQGLQLDCLGVAGETLDFVDADQDAIEFCDSWAGSTITLASTEDLFTALPSEIDAWYA